MKDTLKGGFWVALGLFILYLAVTGKLNALPALGLGIKRWWLTNVWMAPEQVKPSGSSGAGSAPSVGQQAQAIQLAPLSVGGALSMS
jgi:hypothetical protein